MSCGHVAQFADFELGVSLTSSELEELTEFLEGIAKHFASLDGERLAKSCIGKIRHLRTILSAPAPAGE